MEWCSGAVMENVGCGMRSISGDILSRQQNDEMCKISLSLLMAVCVYNKLLCNWSSND